MTGTKSRGRPREKSYTALLTETNSTVIRFKAGSAREALAEVSRIERYARQSLKARPEWRFLRSRREVSVDLGPLPP